MMTDILLVNYLTFQTKENDISLILQLPIL